MKLAYFDCFAGAAGDMIVGALLDAGLELEVLRSAAAALKLPGCSVSAEKVRRGGMAGTKFHVHADEPGPHHRALADIEQIIGAAELPGRSGETAVAVFRRLAEAEAKVHGTGVGKVHFHEVGAIDSIVDIVSAAVGLESLGVERVLCSPLPVGRGTVETAHGTMPLPSPATAELLAGAPLAECPPGLAGELTTPTAAALLTALSAGFGPPPAMDLAAVGYGAGSRDDGGLPNLLRVFLGTAGGEGAVDAVMELSANLDDCTGEVLGAALEKLLLAGALDAWSAPITMKRSRPGWILSALCLPADAAKIEEVLFAETTTLGVRRRLCARGKLLRRHERVETPYGPVRVKVGRRGDRDVTASPEFADALAAAEAHGVPVKEVLAAAVEAFRRRAT